jgi:outer membrane protein OmpA-like peptidoglycan-associated protein
MPLCLAAQDSIVVHFNFNSDQLTTRQINILKKSLNSSMHSIGRIVGFTDSLGVDIYNLDLSQRRAQNVKKLLDSLNPQVSNRAAVIGNGEVLSSNPLDRKVVIYFQQKLSDKIKSAKVGDNIKMNQLNFQPGLDLLLPESIPTLSELLTTMVENPKLQLAVEGHICCATSDELNLSGMRAKVVYNYLVNNGISANRLSHQGFGSSRPIIPLPETTEEERIQNRRVELRIVAN